MATLYCQVCKGDGKVGCGIPGCFCTACGTCSGKGYILEESGLQDKFGPAGVPPSLDNPKDAVGRAKVDLSLVPMTAIAHEAHAMMDGAKKYQPYNWRGRKVSARVYVAAALRHIGDYYNREDVASDSLAHHLGHARACLGIVLDALETGNLIDDRPAAAPMSALLERLNKAILEKGLHIPTEEKK